MNKILGISSFVGLHVIIAMVSIFEAVGLSAFCHHVFGWSSGLIFWISIIAINVFQSLLVHFFALIACLADIFIFWGQGGKNFWCPAILLLGVFIYWIFSFVLWKIMNKQN